MAPTTPSNRRACSYTPPVAEGRGRRSQPPLRKVRTRIEASAAQRARGKDLIMAQSSRTMREDLPDTAVAEARLRKRRLYTTAQQIGGRAPGPPLHRKTTATASVPAPRRSDRIVVGQGSQLVDQPAPMGCWNM